MPSWSEPESLGLQSHYIVLKSCWRSLIPGTKLFGRLTNPAHCLYLILPGDNKSHEFLLRKRGPTFTLLNLYQKLFPIVFLSSYNILRCCVSQYLPCCTVPVLMHCSRLMTNYKTLLTYILEIIFVVAICAALLVSCLMCIAMSCYRIFNSEQYSIYRSKSFFSQRKSATVTKFLCVKGVNRITYWSQGVASLPHKCSLPPLR